MDGGWAAPFDTDLQARRGLAFQLIEGAAKLGPAGLKAPGLEGFGKPDGFHDRQVDRWLVLPRLVQGASLPGLDVARIGCAATAPPLHAGIMHGDYQFANVIMYARAPYRLAAIVDWEMTTIGDPLRRRPGAVGYDGEEPKTQGFYLPMEGMPTRTELLAHYEKLTASPPRTSTTTWCWRTGSWASC